MLEALKQGKTNEKVSSDSEPLRLTAWVAGIFSFVLALAMLLTHLGTRAEDPLKSVDLKQLKQKLREAPKDEKLKQEIRQLDLSLRQTYFRQISRMGNGTAMLLGGVVVLLVSRARVNRGRKLLPRLDTQPAGKAGAEQSASRARWSVAGAGSADAALLMFFTVGAGSPVPHSPPTENT